MKNFWSTLAAIVIGLSIVISVSYYIYKQMEADKFEKAYIQKISYEFIDLLGNAAASLSNCKVSESFDHNPIVWISDYSCVQYKKHRDEVIEITNGGNIIWSVLKKELETNIILKEEYNHFLLGNDKINARVLKMEETYEKYNEARRKYNESRQ